jgi:hypothetical protein
VAAGDDPDTIEECDLALLRLCRRFLTTDLAASDVARLARAGSPLVRAEAWLVLTLVRGERPASPREAGSWDGWWQCQDRQTLLSGPQPDPPPERETGIPAEITAADSQEYAALFGDSPLPPRIVPPGPPGLAGRAMLAAAEASGLRFPQPAANELREAARLLRAAGDAAGAAHADRLAQALLPAPPPPARMSPSVPTPRAYAGKAGGRGAGGRARAVCATCGYRNAADAEFCASCGSYLWWDDEQRSVAVSQPEQVWSSVEAATPYPLQPVPRKDTVRCGTCAADNDADRRFCRVCRSPLPRPPWWRRLLTRRVLVLALVLASVLGLGYALLATRVLSAAPPAPAPGGRPDVAVDALTVVLVVVAATAALAAGIVAVATVRHVYRFGHGRTVFVNGATGATVHLTGVRDHGIAQLEAGWAARLALRLHRLRQRLAVGRRVRWVADVQPENPPVRLDVSGLRLPRKWSRRSLTLVQLVIDGDLEHHPWERWLLESVDPTARRGLLVFRSELRGIPTRRAGVRHIVGTPVGTAAGWRLRTLDAADPAGPESRGRFAGERLASAEDLAAGVVVLQAEPVDGPPMPLGDLRRGFTGLARELLDAGISAVLVMPPLPDTLGHDIRTALARRLKRRRPRPSDLLAVLADLTAAIGPDADLLLYVRPERPEGEAANG